MTKGIKIEAGYDEGGLTTAVGTKITDMESGVPLTLVQSVVIHPLEPNSILRADVTLFLGKLVVEGAAPAYFIRPPGAREDMKIMSVCFADGSQWVPGDEDARPELTTGRVIRPARDRSGF